MSLLPLLFLTFLPFISSHLIAVAPAIGIAGQAYPIRITSDGGTTTATIYGSANGVNSGSTAGFTSVITAGSSASDITLTIPSSAPTGQYRLDITTTTNASAIYRSDITIWYHPYDIAIELDKPVYQPGQTVYIQLIVIDNQMKPVQLTGAEGVRLEMSDSKQTKLARISNITTDTYGMVTLSLPLSTEPSYGTYTLSLTRGNFFITSTTFELMSYQLPKFSVVVASHQSSLTSTSTKLSGNITAMYVYGKPVQGTVSINITQAPYTPWYGWEGIMPIGMMPPRMVDAVGDVGVGGGVAIGGPSGSSSSSSTTKSVLATLTIPLDATGVTQWSIDTQGKSVSSNGITITATVTETATGASESGSTHVSYAWQSIQTAIVGSDTAVKPGIPFICALLAVDVDGKPVDGTFTLTVNEQSNVFPYSRQLIQKSITTSQGRVTFEITGNISSTATSINVNIQGQSITASAYANFGIAYSPSKSYVEISQTSTSLVLEQDASFTIRTAISSTAHTSNTATAIWSIISQGDIITGGTSALTLSNGLSTTGVTIPITSAIKGSGTVLVYIRLTSGEVIADSLPINVPVTYPLDVTATFNPKSSQPGDEIVVDVDTSGVAARVALAAVDEAVLLVAGKGSRINIQSLLTASDRTLASVATSTSSSKSSPYTYYYRTRTATADVFTNSKVVVLTDTSTSIPVINPYEYDGQFPPVAAAPDGTGPVAVNAGGGAGGGAADNAAPSPTTSKDATSSSSSTAPTRVRSYFPESFLTFKPITTDATGKATVPLTTPDSITTWNLHAIAMSSRGLGISSTSTLTVMLPLFLDVYLPKIAVRGEIIPITIAIKSYISSTTTVTLTLAPSSQYTIITSSSSTNTAGNNHIYTLPVAGTSIVAVTYIIQPKVLGEIQIAANATSAVYSDGIITSLKITPEGLPRTYTLNQLITLDTSTPTSTITWSTYLPAEAVPGSATAYLHVTGDLMGQVMSNVEGLVQQPTGCGEQNMINFAPLIYVTSYITSAKLVKPDLVSRAITMMRQGYARELNYRRTDGSFSAFGNNDPIGSIWLSAFVLRCFAQSRVHTNLGMYVDPQVLKVTGDYLVGKQNSGGDYPLIGKVLHDDMTGGTGQVASPALTAYITLTLIETGGYDDAVNKGLNYLVSQASAVTGNLYQTILLAYTLKRGGSTSSATTSLYTAMKAAAKTDADGMYWSTTTSTPSNEKAPWCYHCQPKSLQVEMTAYALLTLLAYDDLVTAFPVAKWLLNHRSSLGGYSSTQDTVVALEALSAYAIKATGNSDMSLSISQDGIATSSITINAQNSDLLQSKPITVNNGSSLIITATGTGRALIQLAVAYHVNTDTTTPSYNMNVDYAKSNNNDTLTVQACVQALNNEKSGMIVSEVGLFTGYEPISSSVSALTAKGPASLIRRVDTSPRNVVLYWGDVITTTSPTCITFLASRVMNVDSLQDAVSTTYSYYKPQIAVSKSVSYEATSKPVPTPGPNVPSSGMILVPSTLFVILLSIFVTIVA